MIYKDLTLREQATYNKVCDELTDLNNGSIKNVLDVMINIRFEYLKGWII